MVAYADQIGLTRYKVNIPEKTDGVYTLSANTMSGDIIDTSEDAPYILANSPVRF
jgi:uncharacterized iron-regulated membrane protein